MLSSSSCPKKKSFSPRRGHFFRQRSCAPYRKREEGKHLFLLERYSAQKATEKHCFPLLVIYNSNRQVGSEISPKEQGYQKQTTTTTASTKQKKRTVTTTVVATSNSNVEKKRFLLFSATKETKTYFQVIDEKRISGGSENVYINIRTFDNNDYNNENDNADTMVACKPRRCLGCAADPPREEDTCACGTFFVGPLFYFLAREGKGIQLTSLCFSLDCPSPPPPSHSSQYML